MYTEEQDILKFEYPIKAIFKAFIESGINVYEIVSEDGIPDLETYEDYFPFVTQGGGLVTEDMKKRLLGEVLSMTAYIVRKLASDSYGIVNEYSVSDNVEVSIRNHEKYSPVDKEAFDIALRDMIVYGALQTWTRHSSPEAVKAKVTEMYSNAEQRVASLAKKLECVLLRKELSSSIFDNMITSE